METGEPDEKELITYSRRASFNRCRRQHFYAYELGRRPVKDAKPLMTGTAMHRWLEGWFLLMQELPINALDTAEVPWICPVAPLATAHEDRPEGDLAFNRPIEIAFEIVQAEDAYEAARLRAMVLAYYLRWRRVIFRVRAVEPRFQAPLINPDTGRASQTYDQGGKIDAIVDDPDYADTADVEWVDGSYVQKRDTPQLLVEHKSNRGALDVESSYWTKLRSNGQVSDYFVGAKSLGFEPVGMLYDVVCKPDLKPLSKTENPQKTKGTGCKKCGGSSGVMGTGGHAPDCEYLCTEGAACNCRLEHPCPVCKGGGWKVNKDGTTEEPRWRSGTRLEDETPGEYGMRCFLAMVNEPERYLHRRKVVRLEHEIREHMIDGWHTTKMLHEVRRSGVAPRNPDACHTFNMQCPYYDVCWGGAKISDDTKFRNSGKHPELRVINE